MGNTNQNDLIPGLLFFVVLLMGGVWLISQTRTHVQTRHNQVKLFVIAILVRFAATLAIYEMGLSSVIGDEDSSGYFLGRYYGGLWIGQNRSIFELPSRSIIVATTTLSAHSSSSPDGQAESRQPRSTASSAR